MMNRILQFTLGCVAAWMVCADPAAGREATSAADLYSQGVHAYFAGRAGEAELRLSQALELHPYDPRMYYFRGLSRLRLGRSGEARHDMQVAAALEAERPSRYGIGHALQRVQGSDRLLLERYRREARQQATEVGEEQSRERRVQLIRRDPAVLRSTLVIPLDELLHEGEPRVLSAEELVRLRRMRLPQSATPAPVAGSSSEANPFEDDTAQPAADAVARPAPATATPPSLPPDQADEEDPFGDFEN